MKSALNWRGALEDSTWDSIILLKSLVKTEYLNYTGFFTKIFIYKLQLRMHAAQDKQIWQTPCNYR